jgi:hypothetical protein
MTSLDDVLKIATYGGFEIEPERGAYVAEEFASLWPLLESLSTTDVGTTEPATTVAPMRSTQAGLV